MMTEPIIVRSGYNSGEKCHGLTVTRSNITVMSQAFGLAIFFKTTVELRNANKHFLRGCQSAKHIASRLF